MLHRKAGELHDNLLLFFCLLISLVGFLAFSSATRLYHRVTSDCIIEILEVQLATQCEQSCKTKCGLNPLNREMGMAKDNFS